MYVALRSRCGRGNLTGAEGVDNTHAGTDGNGDEKQTVMELYS